MTAAAPQDGQAPHHPRLQAIERLRRRSQMVLGRFAAKLVLIAAAAPWTGGSPLEAIGLLASLWAVVAFGRALKFRQRPNAAALNYWDEALGFAAITAFTIVVS